MDNVRVLVTGVGAPGIRGTLFSLKENPEGREVFTVGTDIRKDVVGRYLLDVFHQIPKPDQENFIPSLLKICKGNVDVVLPQVTKELPKLSAYKKKFEAVGTTVAVSSEGSISCANNKHKLMLAATSAGVPTPDNYLVNRFSELERCMEKLGWPEKLVVIKPPVSSGMRGLRIINEKIDRKTLFYAAKPTEVYVKKDELSFLGEKFPELLVMEYLPGPEYSVDVLARREEVITVVPRRRDLIRSGITFNGTVEKNEEVINYAEKMTKKIGLEYAFGFQFKLDEEEVPKLLECNPRIQGTMVLSTLAGANVIYGAVKMALGEEVPEFHVKWGTRLLRYWGGIGVYKGRKIKEI